MTFGLTTAKVKHYYYYYYYTNIKWTKIQPMYK